VPTSPDPGIARDYYPGRGPDDCIEYTSLINIRPAQGNRSMEVEDPDLLRFSAGRRFAGSSCGGAI
jgi:hypothetical protein